MGFHKTSWKVRGERIVKFVCYKEFDDPQEPILPGIFRSGKVLPLARAVAVAEALAPKGVSVPNDLNAVMARLPELCRRR